MNLETSLNQILIITAINGIVLYLSYMYTPKFFKNIFGICVSNEKTSLYHIPLLRGYGLFYLLSLISVFIISQNFLNFQEYVLIITSCLIGFYDDKNGISQRKKLVILSFVIIIFSIHNTDFNEEYNVVFLKYFFNLLSFIFLVLFFNQIDGINGLAAITFLIALFFISLLSSIIIQMLPIFVAVLLYLYINMKGNIAIQGESGSFFMGSIIYILLNKNFNIEEHFYGLVILGPVLFDIIATTTIRFIYNKNLFEGHRNNLYQKLVSKYNKHSYVSFSFGFLQIIFSCILLIIINTLNKDLVTITLLFFGIITFIIFLYVAIKIQKDLL